MFVGIAPAFSVISKFIFSKLDIVSWAEDVTAHCSPQRWSHMEAAKMIKSRNVNLTKWFVYMNSKGLMPIFQTVLPSFTSIRPLSLLLATMLWKIYHRFSWTLLYRICYPAPLSGNFYISTIKVAKPVPHEILGWVQHYVNSLWGIEHCVTGVCTSVAEIS